ncbi:putative aminoglycoside phosphotransferase [Rubrobacter radiotolerans]|uniref:Phosphotransferase family protein n=1 Tax=Rubrobacter radiotolerans TaxID=42256 RepID=A0A023X5Y2_RUBRA|nr:phosphotransferase family protein [Rubrobacter radiotolerans]AHY47887.1 putative aminoglycoside phosphotransferase [Rubrobacter radiotolerans]MDX5892526.1 phosphotransferase family protein [Rubrobacter radiotolerans]SMC07817.1 Predicted kinase, aminoglycoside phosphotransferase (APT) family [Rubrobacter radiotolerans DSM 5868]
MSGVFAAELGEQLSGLLGKRVEIDRAVLVAGGASKEAWVVNVKTAKEKMRLFVRRAAGGVIYSETISLEQEYQVLRTAHEWGVKVPKPYGFLESLNGREALVMECLEGESIGRRVVRKPEFAATRYELSCQMAEELSKIHAIPLDVLPSLPGVRKKPAVAHVLEVLERELDALDEPHPAIELGLLWLRENAPRGHEIVMNHGDFRVGNLILDERGLLLGVVDWEFAHFGDPAEDLAWPLVRAWRFGVEHLHLGGIGEVEPYLEHYNAFADREVSVEDLFYWEVAGNVRWAIGALNQSRRHLSGQERSVELAVLGRLAAEVEHEILYLLEKAC